MQQLAYAAVRRLRARALHKYVRYKSAFYQTLARYSSM
jgi:hypothetical protein